MSYQYPNTFPLDQIVYPVSAIKFAVMDANKNHLVSCRTVGIAVLVADSLNNFQSSMIVHQAIEKATKLASTE